MAAGAAVWLAGFALFLRGLLPGIGFADSAELGACSALLANTHAPGFPLQVLAGRLALLLPLGSPAFRLGLLSASFGALAVAGTFLLARRLGARAGLGEAGSLAGALLAASALALSPSFRWASTMGEKYAMFICAVAWCGWAMARFMEAREARWGLLSAFLFGAAFAAHYQGIYLAVPFVSVLWGLGSARRRAVAVFLSALVPAVRLIYIPLREASSATFRFGNWGDFTGLVQCLGFLDYTDSFMVADPAGQRAFLAGRFVFFLGVLPWREFGLVLVLALAGAWFLRGRAKWALWGALAVFGTNVLMAFSLVARQAGRYDLPGLWTIAVLAGLGWGRACERSRFPRAAALLGVLLPLALGWRAAPAGNPYSAPDRMREALACAPAGSVVFCHDDILLWYAAQADPGLDLTVEWKGQLVRGNPLRVSPTGIPGPVLAGLEHYQEGSAYFWRLARLLAPRPVLLEASSVPFPTTGIRWSGPFVRVTRPGDPGPGAGEGVPFLRALRFRSLLSAEPEWEAPWADRLAAALAGRAREALDAGREGDFRACLGAGLKVRPGSRELRELADRGEAVPRGAAQAAEPGKRALASLQSDRYYWAARYWEDALASAPDDAGAMHGLGSAAFHEERFEDAVRWYDRALRISPRAGELLEGRRKARDAIAARAGIPALERRLAREAPSASLYIGAGNAFWRLGRSKVAEDFYRKALRLDPRSARAWGNLGSALVEQRRLDEGVEAYERAVELDPRNAGVMVNLGGVLLGMRERGRAVEWLERALEAAPGDARAARLLAEARRTGI